MSFYRMPDGEQLFVREYGQGQPVLVLSGLGMLSWQWAAFLSPHKNRFRFIIPEWRGFGASKDCKIPANLDAINCHWQDVRSVVDQLKFDRVIVIAYSMGATTLMHGLHSDHFSKRITAYLHIDQTPKIPVDDTWAFGLFGSKHDEFRGDFAATVCSPRCTSANSIYSRSRSNGTPTDWRIVAALYPAAKQSSL